MYVRMYVRYGTPPTESLFQVNPHQELDDEDDGEVGREEAHAALLAVYAHDGLADEREVHESAVGVAEGEAEELRHQRVLVLGGGAVVLEVFGASCCTDGSFR